MRPIIHTVTNQYSSCHPTILKAKPVLAGKDWSFYPKKLDSLPARITILT